MALYEWEENGSKIKLLTILIMKQVSVDEYNKTYLFKIH